MRENNKRSDKTHILNIIKNMKNKMLSQNIWKISIIKDLCYNLRQNFLNGNYKGINSSITITIILK